MPWSRGVPPKAPNLPHGGSLCSDSCPKVSWECRLNQIVSFLHQHHHFYIWTIHTPTRLGKGRGL